MQVIQQSQEFGQWGDGEGGGRDGIPAIPNGWMDGWMDGGKKMTLKYDKS